MTQAWPIVVDSPQGHGSWPDGLIPRPEQSAVSLGILHECREGKLSFSLRAAELGLCKTGTISDPKLPLSFCLGKCLIGGIMKLIHREKPSSDWRGWGVQRGWSDYISGVPGVPKVTLVLAITRERITQRWDRRRPPLPLCGGSLPKMTLRGKEAEMRNCGKE